jgi:hypothetical protein
MPFPSPTALSLHECTRAARAQDPCAHCNSMDVTARTHEYSPTPRHPRGDGEKPAGVTICGATRYGTMGREDANGCHHAHPHARRPTSLPHVTAETLRRHGVSGGEKDTLRVGSPPSSRDNDYTALMTPTAPPVSPCSPSLQPLRLGYRHTSPGRRGAGHACGAHTADMLCSRGAAL